MKKVKAVLWVIIIAIFGLIVFQNQDFFLARQSLGIDLYFYNYRTAALPAAVLFAGFFVVGWLIAYLFSLADRYRCNRTIKELRHTISSQRAAIDDLKKDIQALKANTPAPEQPMDAPAEETVALPMEAQTPPSVKQD